MIGESCVCGFDRSDVKLLGSGVSIAEVDGCGSTVGEVVEGKKEGTANEPDAHPRSFGAARI